MAKLTDKQELFCQEFLIDLNATQAAIRAGYNPNSAKQQASENLSKPYLQARITDLKNKRVEKVEITAEQVLTHLKNWLESDITETIGLKPEELKELSKEIRQLITSYKHKSKTYEVEGKIIKDEEIEIKFVSKEKALEMIAKHIGFYGEHNQQKQPQNSVQMSASQFLEFVDQIEQT